MRVSASAGTLAPALAVDGRNDTRWGSGQPQHPGQEFRIVFDSPQAIRCVWYDISKWRSDYPRLLEIDAKLADGTKKQLLTTEQYLGIRYLSGGQDVDYFCFDSTTVSELSLIQQGADPVFDWSIAELKFFK